MLVPIKRYIKYKNLRKFKKVFIFSKRNKKILTFYVKKLKIPHKNSIFKYRKFIKKRAYICVLTKRRNIFLVLSTFTGQVRKLVSIGILLVKGKARQTPINIKKTVNLIVKYILKEKIKNLILNIKGNTPKRKKRLIYSTLNTVSKIKFRKLELPILKSHNGCRIPKIRRL
jgi:ribosomal protein S11